MPGSMTIRSHSTPDASAPLAHANREAPTSATTSPYRGSFCMVRGSPSMCMSTTRACVEGRLRDTRLGGVDRDRHGNLPDEGLDDRDHPAQLLRLGDGLGARA